MTNKVVPLIYGISLLVLVPIGAYLLYANRTFSSTAKKEYERITQMEQRVQQLETKISPSGNNNQIRNESTQKESSPGAKILELKSRAQVAVLNGSGVAGAAAKIKKRLEENGYTVSKVDNTTIQTGSVVQVRPGFELLGKSAQDDVKDLNSFPTIETAPEAQGDVVLIIGK